MKMSTWRKYKIAEFVERKEANIQTGPFGTQLKASDYVESGTPVINVRNIGFGEIRAENLEYVGQNMLDCLPSHILEENDIVFARKGAVERHAFVQSQYHGWMQGSDCIRLRISSKSIEPRFLSYFFLTPDHQEWMKNYGSHGATMATLNRAIISQIQVPLPSVETQLRVVDILSNYDRLIDNNTRRITLLEESIHRLYQEWFVYLRFPGCDRVKVIDGVPEGWRRVTADQAIDFKPKTSAPKGAERPFVPMDALSTNLMTIAQIDSRPIGGGAKFRNEDTLLARITPCLENGKTAFVQFMDDPGMVASGSTEFIVMRSKQVTSRWVYCLARSYHFRQHAINSMAGSDGRQRVKPEALEQFELLLPPSPILKRFDEIAAPIFRQIQLLNSQNQKLREARDLLLPRLMNGSLAV